MKKIAVLTLTLLLSLSANAQVVRSGSSQTVRVKKELERKPTTMAIGLVGGLAQQFSIYPFGKGIEAGLDFQCNLGQHSRLDMQLYVNQTKRSRYFLGYRDCYSHTSSLSLSATYQYVFHLVEGWNCYAGAGVSLSYDDWYMLENHLRTESGQGLTAGVLGVVGTEYRFKAPLAISFDIRPWYRSVQFSQGIFGLSYQLGLRYTF